MEKLTNTKHENPLEDLEKLITILRGENGCPWDKKQDPNSISIYLIEEVYELVDAILNEDPDLIMEELGDVLFQVLFLSDLFSELGYFDLQKVVTNNIEKMKRRHPHVFGNEIIEKVEQIKSRWNQIKAEERINDQSSLLSSIPKGMPTLLRAYRLSERAAGVGFDWDNIEAVMEQVKEEWFEFIDEIKSKKRNGDENKKSAMEFGDILFSLVNIARFAKIHPETALMDSIQKFEKRFRFMEKKVRQKGQNLESLSRKEWNLLWREAKLST